MVSSVEPAAAGVMVPLQMVAGKGGQDAGGARVFAELMQGLGQAAGAQGGVATAVNSAPAGSANTELMKQLSAMYDATDPIKSQYVMMDVLGQRMEALGRMHVTMSVTSGFTGIFKQLFNRHD